MTTFRRASALLVVLPLFAGPACGPGETTTLDDRVLHRESFSAGDVELVAVASRRQKGSAAPVCELSVIVREPDADAFDDMPFTVLEPRVVPCGELDRRQHQIRIERCGAFDGRLVYRLRSDTGSPEPYWTLAHPAPGVLLGAGVDGQSCDEARAAAAR